MSETVVTETKTSSKTDKALLDEVFQVVNRGDAPGLVVGVARHGKVIYRRGFGLASVELGIANTPATRMRIGSTTKHIACLAALMLAEEGRLDIDAPARRYLPELPELHIEPTLRQFMTHTSGLRDYLDIGFLSDGMAIKPKGVALATQVRQREVNFAPGDNMIYNNGGYHLLSLVIERVSGTPFEQFLKDRIFTPLDMIDTDSVPSDFEICRGVATLHVPQAAGGYRRGIFPTEEVRGEGAIISTIDDMLRWLAHLRGPKRMVNEQSWAQMLAPTRLNNGSVIPYGLGLMRHAYRKVEVIHHAGGVIGGACQMLTVPSEALDIIIITNGAPVSPIALANQVIDTLIDPDVLGPPETKAQSDRFKSVLGRRYCAAASGRLIGFADVGGQLGLAVLNMPAAPLRDEGDALRLGFEDIAAGPFLLKAESLIGDGIAPQTLEVSEAGNKALLQLLPETAASTALVGQALVGNYRAPDLNADAHIAFDGEALKFHIQGAFGTNVLTLEALTDEVLTWRIDGFQLPVFGTLRVERRDERVKAFSVDTLRTRHLIFTRTDD